MSFFEKIEAAGYKPKLVRGLYTMLHYENERGDWIQNNGCNDSCTTKIGGVFVMNRSRDSVLREISK